MIKNQRFCQYEVVKYGEDFVGNLEVETEKSQEFEVLRRPSRKNHPFLWNWGLCKAANEDVHIGKTCLTKSLVLDLSMITVCAG